MASRGAFCSGTPPRSDGGMEGRRSAEGFPPQQPAWTALRVVRAPDMRPRRAQRKAPPASLPILLETRPSAAPFRGTSRRRAEDRLKAELRTKTPFLFLPGWLACRADQVRLIIC